MILYFLWFTNNKKKTIYIHQIITFSLILIQIHGFVNFFTHDYSMATIFTENICNYNENYVLMVYLDNIVHT